MQAKKYFRQGNSKHFEYSEHSKLGEFRMIPKLQLLLKVLKYFYSKFKLT